MSIEALTWVFQRAPIPSPGLVTPLTGLANYADPFGRGSHPTQEVMAAYTRKCERQVRKDLLALEEAALIRRGDQQLVAHYPADKRPIVWDLALEIIDEELDQFWRDRRGWRAARKLSTGGNSSSGRGGNSSSGRGGNSSSGRGGNSSSPIPKALPNSLPTAVPYVSPDVRADDFGRSAAEWLSGLPNASRVSGQRRAWITDLAARALAAGWTPEALRREVLDGTERARDRWALYGHRLEHLGPPERLQLAESIAAETECPLCGHPAIGGQPCDKCRGNVRGASPVRGPSRPHRAS